MNRIKSLPCYLMLGLLLQGLFLWVTCAFAEDTLKRHVLPNGLTLMSFQAKGSRQVVIDTWFGVGSVFETPQFNGMSHFLEHVLFKSAPDTPSFDTLVERFGGYTNAATSRDFTHYYYVVPSRQFKDVLPLHLKMLFQPAFPAEAIQEEQPVVQEEIARAKNAPFRPLFDALYATLYQQHPTIAQTIAGPMEQIATFDKQKVQGYYQAYYSPTSAFVLVSSPFSHAEIEQQVSQFFQAQSTQAGAKIPPITSKINWDSLPKDWQSIYAPVVPLPILLWAFPEAPETATAEEKMAYEVLLYMLAGHDESELSQALVKQAKNPAYAVGASWMRHRFEGFSYLYVMSESSHLALQEKRIQGVLGREDWLTPIKLKRAKEALKLALAQEKSHAPSYLEGLGEAVLQNRFTEWQKQSELLSQVQIEDVRNAYQAMKRRMKNHTVGFILRSESQKKEKPPSQHPRLILDHAVLNKPVTHVDAVTKERDEVATSVSINGFQAYQKILPNAELLGMNWQFPISQRTLQEKMNLSLLEALWLKAPLKSKPAVTIQAYLDAIGVSVSFQVEEDWVSVYFESTSDHVSALLEAQRLLLEHQQGLGFDEAAFDLERQNQVQSIRLLQANPQALLFAHANQQLAKGQLKGLQLEERLEALNALRFDEVKSTWQRVWGNAPVAVVMSGREEALEDLKAGLHLNGLLKGHHAIEAASITQGDVKVNEAVASPTMQTQHVLKADQATTWLLWGWQLPSVQHPDMPALHLLQTYLGQGMSSLLFQEVREKRGLAYEVSSQLETQVQESRMTWHAGVKPENVAETQAIFQAILTRLASTPLSVSELNALKEKRLGRFDLALNTPEQWVQFTGKLLIQGFPLHYIERYRQQLEAVTPADLQRVARQYLGNAPHLNLTLGKPLPETAVKGGTPHAR